MRRFITPIVVVLALLLTSSQVCAWSAAGHTVVGAIAYDVMVKERPKELAKVLAILRQHPQYDTVLKAKVESVQAENRDRYLLMIAARWPDDVSPCQGRILTPDLALRRLADHPQRPIHQRRAARGYQCINGAGQADKTLGCRLVSAGR